MKRLRHLRLHSRVRALENSASKSEITMEQALLLAERAYKAEPYSGSALLIRFHDEAWEYGPDPLMGWSGLVKGKIDIVDLEGGHITGMSPVGAPAKNVRLKSDPPNWRSSRCPSGVRLNGTPIRSSRSMIRGAHVVISSTGGWSAR